tara:strand:+ start:3721 stop:3993 length:273 start_codon:yes stop_codon:yes gene_type:complete
MIFYFCHFCFLAVAVFSNPCLLVGLLFLMLFLLSANFFWQFSLIAPACVLFFFSQNRKHNTHSQLFLKLPIFLAEILKIHTNNKELHTNQ